MFDEQPLQSCDVALVEDEAIRRRLDKTTNPSENLACEELLGKFELSGSVVLAVMDHSRDWPEEGHTSLKWQLLDDADHDVEAHARQANLAEARGAAH